MGEPATPRNTNDEDRPLLLSCWTPMTTRALSLSKSSSSNHPTVCASCWNVLDHVLPQSHHTALLEELQRPESILGYNTDAQNNLLPARTAGEVQLESLRSPIRGDKSRFLSYQERQSTRFRRVQHPQLSHLLSCIQETVSHHVGQMKNPCPTMTLDPSRTSVQVAVYAGDGISGYPRHCDRSQACQSEQQKVSMYESARTTETNMNDNNKSPDQRIITAIYYLTPLDWDETLDGGALRLFSSLHNNNGFSPHHHDVVPYSNRLVVFRSDVVEHQVLPSLRRDRAALTVWFYGRTKGSVGENVDVQRREAVPLSKTLLPPLTTMPPPLPIRMSTDSSPCSVDKNNNNTIFVSIAAYRDSELVPTLHSLLSTAQNANRVFVGIVLQYDPTQDAQLYQDVVDATLSQPHHHPNNLRLLTLQARHAQGPCYARALAQQLYRDEDYVLQIDSHMRFRPCWDTYLIQQIQSLQRTTRNDRVLLTAYPVGYRLLSDGSSIVPSETRGTVLVPWKFDVNDGLLRQRGRLLADPTTNSNPRPIRCHLYAAGFNFGPGSVLEECPYDASLRHLFFGEELSMAVRLFTHGYDSYAPRETVCYHLWSRVHRPKDDRSDAKLEEERTKHRTVAQRVVREHLLGRGSGLGTVRSASDFSRVLGVDFAKRTMEEGATDGGLRMEDFAIEDIDPYFEPGSVEEKVASLTAEAQGLIASFLSGMQSQ